MTFMIHTTSDSETRVDIRGTAYTALILARQYEQAGHLVVIETLDKRRYKASEFIRLLVNGTVSEE